MVVSVVVTHISRVDQPTVDAFSSLGVATVHEAQGRIGLMASNMRSIFRPAHIAGTAVTCEVAPGDNGMIHVAVEQCQPGDVLVVIQAVMLVKRWRGGLEYSLFIWRGKLADLRCRFG